MFYGSGKLPMTNLVAVGHLNVCAVAALCIAALGSEPANALLSDASDMVLDTGDVHELAAIDGSGEQVYLDFKAPLERIVASLLRTSSYQWPYSSFEALLKRHGRSKVRAAIADRLRATSDNALLIAHKAAAGNPMSPLSELRLPGDTWKSMLVIRPQDTPPAEPHRSEP
jgi:hypothetical protein